MPRIWETIISDERLDELGEEFVKARVLERQDITFSQFVEMQSKGTWSQYEKYRDSPVVGTTLSKKQVEFFLSSKDTEIKELAEKWVEKYEEVDSQAKRKENILQDASALLTLDSQLYHLLTEGGYM